VLSLSDKGATAALAARLDALRPTICIEVAEQLLEAFPELHDMLRLRTPSPAARLSAVSVERLCQLVRAMLLFGEPSLADKEFRWAWGVLPRSGVRAEQQVAMVHWFFDALRRDNLTLAETQVASEVERYLIELIPRTATGVKPR